MAGRKQQLLVFAAVMALVAGCRATRQIRDPEYAQVASAVRKSYGAPPLAAPAAAPVLPDLAGPHTVEDYVRVALSQNPEVQAARKRVEASAHQVPVAASLPDPMFGVTAFPEPVQTAAGRQEAALNVGQKFPWRRKLAVRAGVAEEQTNVDRAQLAAAELAIVARVKTAYYELYYVQQAIRITEVEREELIAIRAAASAQYRGGLVNQQDVLRADLELSNIESEMIRLRQQLASAQARLARVLHVSPQTELRAVQQLEPEAAVSDLEELQRRAIAARPELHAQLAALSRDRAKAQLARLDYVPDVTLGARWVDVASAGISPVANGQDSVWLTAELNLPIYRKRLSSAVMSAEAAAVATARDYDTLRDATQEQVADLFAKARSQQDLLMLFEDDILPKARQTLEVSSRAYSVGEVDFLQLIDNFRTLLRYELSYRRLEASLRQTLADLERVVGGFIREEGEPLPSPPPEGEIPLPADNAPD